MSTAGESVSSLMIECDNNEEFIIANLSSSVINETLDLAFNEGEKICFKVKGGIWGWGSIIIGSAFVLPDLLNCFIF